MRNQTTEQAQRTNAPSHNRLLYTDRFQKSRNDFTTLIRRPQARDKAQLSSASRKSKRAQWPRAILFITSRVCDLGEWPASEHARAIYVATILIALLHTYTLARAHARAFVARCVFAYAVLRMRRVLRTFEKLRAARGKFFAIFSARESCVCVQGDMFWACRGAHLSESMSNLLIDESRIESFVWIMILSGSLECDRLYIRCGVCAIFV